MLAAERLRLTVEVVAESNDLEAGLHEERVRGVERGGTGRDHAHVVAGETVVVRLRCLEARILEHAAELREPGIAIALEDAERVVPGRAVRQSRTGRDIGR